MSSQNRWKLLAVLIVASALLGVVGWQQVAVRPGQSDVTVSIASVDEAKGKYLAVLGSLKNQSFSTYASARSLCFEDRRLTDLEIQFLNDPERYGRNLLDSYIGEIEGNGTYAGFGIELRKVPEVKSALEKADVAVIESVEDIVYSILSSQSSIPARNLKTMLDEGIKEKRKYCTPLQALVWHHVENEPSRTNPLEDSTFTVRDFTASVWKASSTSNNYQSDRWKDFDEVIDRLNSPFLVAKYMDDQFIYDAPKVVFDPDRTVAAKQTFAKKVGACHDMANFAAYCLIRNGYEAYILRGGQKNWQKKEVQGNVITSRSHSVALYKEGPSFFVIQGPLPENRPNQQTVRIEGPFATAEEAARQECCAKMGYAYEWHQLFKPDDPSFDAGFFRKW